MSELERAKLIPVSGNNDTPDMNNAIDVQFNPVTLKVNLANTLKANQSQGNSRAAQFVDKSSSTLTVELIFDTTYIEPPSGDAASSTSNSAIEQGSDVRLQTKKIAEQFMKPIESGGKMQAPSRVLFQWGSFEFVGMVQSYDETLDFFSPKGRPLRATLSLKLSEDRFQFRSNDSDALAAEQSPSLSFTGNGAAADSGAGNGAPAPNQDTNPVPGSSNDGPGSWRDNAMFNGIESPRLPAVTALALPSVSLQAGAGFGISGGAGIGVGVGAGFSAGLGISGGVSASVSASATLAASGTTGRSAASGSAGATAKTTSGAPSAVTPAVTPAFKYGNSSALGTNVPGAFNPQRKTSLTAAGLQQGSLQLRQPPLTPSASGGSKPDRTAPPSDPGKPAPRRARGVSVIALLKQAPDDGVGFD